MLAEVITYKGVSFRRYPDSERWSDRMYFTPGQADRARGVRRLHEEVWQDTHGCQVPDGHHIHHADFDQLNNEPGNLVCLSHGEHMRVHRARGISDKQRAHLDKVRPLASAWHSSPEGRLWHRENAIAGAAVRSAVSATCERCGAEYMSKTPRRFCSPRCRAAARRAAGADNEQRTCHQCGSAFTANRYSKTRFCGRACAATAQHAK